MYKTEKQRRRTEGERGGMEKETGKKIADFGRAIRKVKLTCRRKARCGRAEKIRRLY